MHRDCSFSMIRLLSVIIITIIINIIKMYNAVRLLVPLIKNILSKYI